MTKQADAIAKVNAEMASNRNNTYVQAVGNLLLLHLNEHPEAAEDVLKTDKTITKSLEEMRKTAERKKVGNVAVLTDAEGFAIVLEYFKSAEPAAKAPTETKPDKPEKPSSKPRKPPAEKKPEPSVETPTAEDDDIDFDSLLL